jgi:hypothetical protein
LLSTAFRNKKEKKKWRLSALATFVITTHCFGSMRHRPDEALKNGVFETITYSF